jgi:selenocysteine-specific elongation factor
MKSVIIGTAGHIDHGKTALVKALTGIDADRLEEEKRRGITIDLGFAHLELPAPDGGERLRLGFVDVPGHERFVRNMLAGVGGIDLVLLVIAADEAIKPQTREHFDICSLLNIPRGLAVLTKADLVDGDTLEVVRLEVADFLRGSFLEGAPILAASSLTGDGIERLKRELARVAAEVPARDRDLAFRLPIDRVFTMKGFGTVVTGTLVSGSVRKEDEVEVFPSGRRVRVRGIQVHNEPAGEAHAGQRTALNLAGIGTEELGRGMSLAAAGQFRATRQADARVFLLPGVRPLRQRARVHFHCHASETLAEVVFLPEEQAPEQDQRRAVAPGSSVPGPAGDRRLAASDFRREIVPGGSRWARLRFADPLLLLPGDRFILRQFSPVTTIGGGEVVDALPLPGRPTSGTTAFLRVVNGAPPETVLRLRVARRMDQGLPMADAVAETGCSRWMVEKHLGPEVEAGRVLRFDDRLIGAGALEELKVLAARRLRTFHDANPLETGINKEEFRHQLRLGPEVFAGLLEALAREHQAEVAGELVRQPGRGVVMDREEAESKRRIEGAFLSAGLQAPALKDVLNGLNIDRARAQRIVTLLLRERVLVKVSEDLVFHQSALAELRRKLAGCKQGSPRIDVGRFKELAGVTRKHAIPLLEYLDRERVTRRAGNERIIL